MTQPHFACFPAEQLRGLQAQLGLLCPLDPPRDPVEKPREYGGKVKKPWACTAEWNSSRGRPMMPKNPEVLHFQHPSPAQESISIPLPLTRRQGRAAKGKDSTEKNSSRGKKATREAAVPEIRKGSSRFNRDWGARPNYAPRTPAASHWLLFVSPMPRTDSIIAAT